MDYYERLRPRTDFSVCACAEIHALLLVYTMSDNPIHCFECKGQVDPERLSLSELEVSSVASWDVQFSSLYELWLASGEYEAWAKAQMLAPKGQVNRDGLRTAQVLSKKAPTFYWWFHDSDDALPVSCPSCDGPLVKSQRHGELQCMVCRVIV